MSPRALHAAAEPLPPLLSFTVPGDPIPQAALSTGKTGRSYYKNGKDLHPWRDLITEKARRAMRAARWPEQPTDPMHLGVLFVVKRPPSVRRAEPSVRPDLQHFVRAIEDAITAARAWKDDGQITRTLSAKQYVSQEHPSPCTLITVWPASASPLSAFSIDALLASAA